MYTQAPHLLGERAQVRPRVGVRGVARPDAEAAARRRDADDEGRGRVRPAEPLQLENSMTMTRVHCVHDRAHTHMCVTNACVRLFVCRVGVDHRRAHAVTAS